MPDEGSLAIRSFSLSAMARLVLELFPSPPAGAARSFGRVLGTKWSR